MANEDLKQYFNLYTDCWKLFRKYQAMDDIDINGIESLFDSLVLESDELYKKYSKATLAKDLILATVNEIEFLFKEATGSNDAN